MTAPAAPTTSPAGGPSSIPSSEAVLRQLELTITRKLDGLVLGDHEGRLPGAGSESGDGRRYEPGDDVRRIDWNLTARSGDVQVRTTIADRELETWFVVDGSASLDYGTAFHEKRDLALAVVAAFAFLTGRAGNRVGALMYGADRTQVIPPIGGREAMLSLLAAMHRRPRTDGEAPPLADALRRVRRLARREGLVVVVSDLLDGSDWPAELRSLAARHDVVVAHLADPREDDLPPVGLLTLVDPETGRRVETQTSSRRFRERYASASRARREDAAAKVKSARAGHLEVSTDRDWLPDVVRFSARQRRRR